MEGAEWVCGSCTFSNGNEATACEMCGSDKPAAPTNSQARGPASGGEQQSQEAAKKASKRQPRRKRRRETGGDDDDDFDARKGKDNADKEDDFVDEADDEARLTKLVNQMQKLNKKSVPLEQPGTVGNCELKQHQLIALGWLASLYSKGLSGILGDEMGLGKTLTAIALLCHLMEEKENHGPFLVVAPLSVVDHWQKEFEKYASTVKTLRYIGEKEEREELRGKLKKRDPSVDFNVLITTPELLRADSEFLQRYKWRYGIIDEAHRLKNPESVFYTTLLEFRITNKLLMTGTPLQNNLKELWALLHFVAPNTFNDLDLFERWFKGIDWMRLKKGDDDDEESVKEKELVNKLQELIRPFLLRRRLNNVILELPPKRELIVYTGLSSMQKKYYKWILTRDVNKLTKGTGGWGLRRGGNRASLANVIMELRKCCNHPYLFDGAEPEFDGQFIMGEHIVENSGKLALLDKLLAKLHKEGHKVLLFSQMTRMLDIVQDYMHYRGYNYERLDGSVRGEERFLAIDRFTAADEEDEDDRPFVFLLSTRAGGVGLNLTVADTVIFLDSDWNPQSDLQAEARVHRIGQTKEVTVIRLVTKDTVEEVILQRALRKLKLSSTVIEEGKFRADKDEEKESPEQLFDIIQYGLRKVITNEDSTIEDEDIDAILARSEANMKNLSIHQVDEHISATQAPTMLPDEEETMELQSQSVKESREKDAEALDAILESSLLAKAGAIAPSQRIGTTPHKSRRHLRGRSVDFNPEEEEAKKKAKMEQRRKKMWKANGYISSSIIATRWIEEADKVEEAEEEPEPEPEAAAAAPKPAVQWVCGSCTFVNPKENDKCEMCDAERTLASASSKGKEKSEEEEVEELTDLDEEGREADDIHFIVGDVTKPVPSVKRANKNAIVVACVDDSGSWGHGGLFRALNHLSPLPAERYAEAGQNKDIQLADIHLVFKQTRTLDEEAGDDDLFCRPSDCMPIAHIAGQGVYVALVIAQTTKRNKVGPIQLPALSQALQKLAPVAKALKASIHMPRMGLRGSDWYAAERSIRRYLVSHGVPTYVYYFRRSSGGRRGGGSGPSAASSSLPSLPASQGPQLMRSASASQLIPPTPPPTPASLPASEPTEGVARPNKKRRMIATEEDEREVAVDRMLVHEEDADGSAAGGSNGSAPAKFLAGLRFYLHLVGAEQHGALRATIKRCGGRVSGRFNSMTTHVLTSTLLAAAEDEALRVAREINPRLLIVTADWLRKCIQRNRLLSTSAA